MCFSTKKKILQVWTLISLCTIYGVHSLEPIPRIRGSGETVTIEAGQTLQLECEVENMPRKLKAKWERCKKFSEELSCISYSGMTSRGRAKQYIYYGVIKEGAEIYKLYVYNIQPNQAGTYYCTVKTARLARKTEDYIHVQVYKKPVIHTMSTTADLVAMEGSPITLNCAASGSPEPLVRWQRAGGVVLPGGGYNRLNNTLEIASCDQGVKGLYICTASNSYGISTHTITVDCLGVPRVQASPSIKHQMVGYQTKFVCIIDSSPEVTRIWWTRDGEDILSDNHRYQVDWMKAALGRVISKLVIVGGVEEADYLSNYSCHTRNMYGLASATVSILESDTPQSMDGRLVPAIRSCATISGAATSCCLFMLLTVLLTGN